MGIATQTSDGLKFSTTYMYVKNSSGTTLAAISSGGNLGIGDISPQVGLSLYGNGNISRIKIATTSNHQLNIGEWDGSTHRIEGDANRKLLITSYSSDGIHLGGSGSSHVVVKDSKLLVGLTTALNTGSKIHVNSAIALGSSTYTYSQVVGGADLQLISNGNPANLGSNSNIIFKLGTSGGGGPSEAMRIVSTGNVGIGTDSPLANLMVGAGARNAGAAVQNQAGFFSGTKSAFAGSGNKGLWQGQLHVSDDSALAAGIGGAITFGATQDNTNGTYLASIEGSRDNATSGQYGASMIFRTRTNGSAVMGSHMVINSVGNVGIGTNNPLSRLSIFKGTSGVAIGEYQNGAVIWLDGANGDFTGGDYFQIRANNSGQLTFGYAGGESVYLASNGRLSIGTSSPVAKLDVRGDLIVDATNNNYGGVRIHDDSSGDYNVYLDMGRNQGNTRFHIRNAGRTAGTTTWASGNDVAVFSAAKCWIPNASVGIGTDSPLEKLDVVGKQRITQNITSNNTYYMLAFGSNRSINDYGGLNKDYWRLNVVTPGSNTTGEGSGHGYGDLRFSSVTGANTTYADRLTVRYNGNVGIGTNVPAAKLDVRGSQGYLKFDTSGSDSTIKADYNLKLYADDTGDNSSGYQNIIFYTAGANERMRIQGNGYVGIGTATAWAPLQVYSSADQKILLSGSANPYIRWQNGGSNRAYIQWVEGQSALFVASNGIFKVGQQTLIEATGGADEDILVLDNNRNTQYDKWGIKFQDSFRTRARIQAVNMNTGNARAGLAFEVGLSTDTVERMRINDNGNIGIGTDNPTSRLDIRSVQAAGDSNGSNLACIILETFNSNSSNYGSYLKCKNYVGGGSGPDWKIGGIEGYWTTNKVASIDFMTGDDWYNPGNKDEGEIAFTVYNNTGSGSTAIEAMRIHQTGNIGIGSTNPGSKLTVNGSFSASSKSFLIDHPTKENKKLEHGCLEGPEFGVYYRGTTQSNTITLPDYWSGLVREDTVTVQLTPRGGFQHLYVVSTSLSEIVIGAADGETVDCFYTIYGERADIDSLVVEKDV